MSYLTFEVGHDPNSMILFSNIRRMGVSTATTFLVDTVFLMHKVTKCIMYKQHHKYSTLDIDHEDPELISFYSRQESSWIL